MEFEKGHKKVGGRKKGVPNKLSGAVKQNIIGVFDRIGGRDAMAEWAKENPTEFYKLYGRLIPHELSGPDGEPIQTRGYINAPPVAESMEEWEKRAKGG